MTLFTDTIGDVEVRGADVLLVETEEDRTIHRPHMSPETTYVLACAFRVGSTHFGASVKAVVRAGRVEIRVWRRDGWVHVFETDAPVSADYADGKAEWENHENAAYLDIERCLPVLARILR
jgi:hypothetical protein